MPGQTLAWKEPLLSSDSTLPEPPRAQGQYRTAVAEGGLVMTAGMTPRVDGRMQHAGRLGDDVDVAEGARAAALAAFAEHVAQNPPT